MKILIATDGSKFGDEAIKKVAGFISPDDKTVIKVITVVEPFTPMAPDAFGVAIDYYREAEKTANETAADAVKKASADLESSLGVSEVSIVSEVIRGKFPKHAIVDEAGEWGADLIVVGSHGYGFWDRMLLGSVSSAVVHHAPCSVLVVRTARA